MFAAGGGFGAWLTAWLRRKHGPAEVRKIDAETRSIIIRDDIALGDSVSRLIKEIAEAALDAERRRQEWLLEQEQWQAKVLFWRNKAEELDGELIDSRQANGLLDSRLTHQNNQNKRLKGLLDEHGISYAELDCPKK